MLIMMLLQLKPGFFSLFSHYVYGKYTQKAASTANLCFIFGVETFTALVFILIYFVISSAFLTFSGLTSDLVLWLIAGILLTLSIVFPFYYYRKGHGTKLFISRSLAHNFDSKARLASSNSDAFLLGFISSVPELIFTLPLYILVAIEIMLSSDLLVIRALLALGFILINIAPLLAICFATDSGYHLASIQRFRVKSKPFIRLFVSILYLLIASLIIIFGIFSL